ncbi:MAG: VWA domain-containing protein [Bacteroidales bacterium]|nr:VWA domain-containing protein [Bacteroidales bacterium]
MTYANPEYFWLYLSFIPLIGWYVWKQHTTNASLQISSLSGFEGMRKSYKYYLRHLPFAMRILALSTIIFVLARPQSTSNWSNTTTEGIDIVMSIDLSGSMQAQDLKPNRLQAAIDVATEFVAGRSNDKLGLVVFAGESFTQCPLTTDQSVLINLFKAIPEIELKDGTAIGMGLSTAIARIKDSEAKSKVIILLTDGENNTGQIAPETAAEMAKTFGIRVYTIGVGTNGTAPFPVQTAFGLRYQQVPVKIDEDLLRSIASSTGGEYFRATDNEALKAIYNKIDELEKTKIEKKEYSKKAEEYWRYAVLALLLLMGEILLRNTVLRTIP